jgi:tRNA(Ile)-lysidine synthase
VPLECIEVAVDGRGLSLEAAARAARYAALATALQPDEWLLTAHHQDDQAETLLLQLLRGAGVAGLAAMPARAPLGRGWHLRPFLDLPRAALRRYAHERALDWIEDPMNEDPRHDRVFVRQQVLPLLLSRWPAAARALARSAAHLGAAQAVLDAAAARTSAGLLRSGTLDCAGLLALSAPERANLLRYWLRQQGFLAPSTARLDSIVRNVLASGPAATPLVQLGDGAVRRYRGRLYATRPLPSAAPLPAGTVLTADQPLDLGAGLGRLRLERSHGQGLAMARAGTALTLRWRSGGELLREHPGGPRRELRKLCQEAAIVPWMRAYLPLLYHAGELVAVADLWCDADWRARPDEPGWRLVWEQRPPLH